MCPRIKRHGKDRALGPGIILGTFLLCLLASKLHLIAPRRPTIGHILLHFGIRLDNGLNLTNDRLKLCRGLALLGSRRSLFFRTNIEPGKSRPVRRQAVPLKQREGRTVTAGLLVDVGHLQIFRPKNREVIAAVHNPDRILGRLQGIGKGDLGLILIHAKHTDAKSLVPFQFDVVAILVRNGLECSNVAVRLSAEAERDKIRRAQR
mmetsp:Transcript_462/g.928  ORF Transcript_462/g.928 Transcript_462/m.928 type:complete len:206 (-) Transcript_462:785-1402(-)